MTSGKDVWIALLRGIGPATHKIMPMSKLRQSLEDVGLGEVRTVLATGNLIFNCSSAEPDVRNVISTTIRSFGLKNDVFLRRPEDLHRIVASNPFADASVVRPDKVLVLFFERSFGTDATLRLSKHRGPERIELANREVFVDQVGEIAASKLTSAFLERLMGAPATARNWNSVLRLRAAAEQQLNDR